MTGHIHSSILRLSMTAILIILVLQNFAQPEKKKSTFRLSKNSAVISEYLDSAQYLAARAPFRAIDKINKAVELSIDNNDRNNEALSYWILGNIQQNLNQHELAIENYKKSIAAANSPSSKLRTSTYGNEVSALTLFNAYKHIALSLHRTNNLEDAADYISKCFSGRFVGIDERDKQDARRVQAEVLVKRGRSQEAFDVLNTTLQKEKELNHREGQAKTLIALGTLHQQQKDTHKALDYLSQAKSIAEELRGTEMLVQVNNAMAQIYREQKKPEKEREVRSDNIALSNSAEMPSVAHEQNIEIGKAYANSNQMNKAVPLFEESLEKKASQEPETTKQIESQQMFGKTADLESTADIYKLLSKEYLKRGDTEKSLKYLQSFLLVQDSIKAIRQKELDAALKLSNEIGKNQQRIELLEKERILSERSIEVLKQDKELREGELFTRNIIIGSLCFLLIFLFVGIYFILKSSREKRRANQLLAIKSLQGQMNPHFIFNALNSVNHYISQNDERAANKYLSDFSKLMRSVMETSKHDLIVLSDELEILKLYLQLEHSRFKEKFEYSLKVEEDLDVSEFLLPPMIIQPFLENAIWHGLRYIEGKGLLEINVSGGEKGLTVTITDNGIGRKRSVELKTKNQKMQNSTGMENIETRIRIMNELFKTEIRTDVSDAFEQAADPGTKVSLFIPKNIHQYA